MKQDFDKEEYSDIFYHSPAAKLIILPDAPVYTIIDVNYAYIKATNSSREALVGQSVFIVFPANPKAVDAENIEKTIDSFQQAIQTKKPHVMWDYRYDIPIPGTSDFEERYWTTWNTPVLDEKGDVKYFIHSPLNVTEHYKLVQREAAALKALKTQQEQLYSTFMQAPVGIAIFKGADYVIDLINPPLCNLYGKSVDELLGKPVFDVLVHAKGQGFEGLLNNVRLTGIPFKGEEVMLTLVRNGKIEKVYVDFVYEPFREVDGSISGVIVVATDVSSQVHAKKQLEEAEERARLAVDAVGLGMYDLNLVTGEMVTSTRFANIFGFKYPVARQEYINAFHKEDLNQRLKAHEEALLSGALFYEARVIWPDESVHWLRIRGKVFYGTDQKPLRILGTLLDVTSARLAEDEQQKLIKLVENSVDLMSILRMDGTNAYINKAGMTLLGFENEQQVSEISIARLHTPEDYAFVQAEVLPAVMNNSRWAGEMKVRHIQSGEIFPVFNNCFRIDDSVSGQPIGVGAVMRDLRPEINAKKALAESEKLLQNITKAAPAGLWMANAEGEITYINQTWLAWTGKPLYNDLKQFWNNVIMPEDVEAALKKWRSSFSDHSLFESEFRITHVDGTVHWCQASGKPQYREDGSFAGYIGACVDITEQKFLQKQKDNFIGIASHELKTPVTSIKGYAQVLEKIFLKKGFIQEAGMLSKMDAQINRLTSLIGDLLDVTKINTGKLQFNDRIFEFNPLVREVADDLQQTTSRHTIILDETHTGTVYGDKERIGQVITNLLTNAIKYSPTADKIIVSVAVKNQEVHLCIQDFGIGISTQYLEKVFEQFYRVSGDMQHTFPGLGLGLYISSEIIKRENGRIWVTSKQGEGSVFCFALPLVEQCS